MMSNLFSSFDPSSYFNVTLNWMSSFLFIIVTLPMFWILPNKTNIIFNLLSKKLSSEFKILINSDNSSKTLLFVSIFFFIVCNNALGLFPYIFTSSSHLAMTLTLSLPLWVSLMMYGWFNHMNHMFAHLVPQSTPNLLMPFMVLIESVSNIIRPLTLAVRLMANMVAGHLLMTLLGNQTAVASGFILLGLILTQILLLVLESAVAFIQSYVFAVLSTLYSSEVEAH